MSPASCLLLFSRERRGQSLIEILVASAVGALFVIAAATLITPALRANTQAFRAQTGAALGRELLANVRVWSEGSWNNIWNLARCPSNHYYLNTAASPFASSSGDESITVATTTYKRYFCITNVTRDSGDLITTGAGFNDPSTLEVDVFYSWPKSATASISMYLTRNRSNSFVQTDWSGGPGQAGPATTTNNKFATSTKIDYTTTPGSISISLPGSISLLQQAANEMNSDSSNTLSATFPGNTRAGDLIIVHTRTNVGATITSLTDTLGNTYTLAVDNSFTDSTQVNATLWYAKNILAGADTVTAAFSATGSNRAIAIHEFSGLNIANPLDQVTSSTGSGMSLSTSNVTTLAPNELLFAGATTYGLEQDFNAGTNYTLAVTQASLKREATEYRVVNSTGNYNASMSDTTSTNWSLLMATFK